MGLAIDPVRAVLSLLLSAPVWGLPFGPSLPSTYDSAGRRVRTVRVHLRSAGSETDFFFGAANHRHSPRQDPARRRYGGAEHSAILCGGARERVFRLVESTAPEKSNHGRKLLVDHLSRAHSESLGKDDLWTNGRRSNVRR